MLRAIVVIDFISTGVTNRCTYVIRFCFRLSLSLKDFSNERGVRVPTLGQPSSAQERVAVGRSPVPRGTVRGSGVTSSLAVTAPAETNAVIRRQCLAFINK